MEDRETTIRRVQGRILINDNEDLGELTRALNDTEIPVEVQHSGSVITDPGDSFAVWAFEMARLAAKSPLGGVTYQSYPHDHYKPLHHYGAVEKNSSSDPRAAVKQARKQAMKNKRKRK